MIGVNLGSPAFGSPNIPGTHGVHYSYPGAEDLDYYKARGMELIRLPFRWERVQPTLYGELNTAELARLDEFLNLAEERGMYVTPDMHNFGRYYIEPSADHLHVIGSPQVPRDAFADIWERLSEHFKDRDLLWAWGIMNEPYNMGSYDWFTTAQVGIDAVRQNDMRHPILIGGDAYSGAHRWLQYSNNLYQLEDPADKLIFEAHQYFDARYSGEYDWGPNSFQIEGGYPNQGVELVQPWIGWLETHNAHGFLGEFGVPDADLRWMELLDLLVEHLKEQNISATYWAGGPRWGTYPLRTNIRPNHDESPQMQTMVQHASGRGTGYWPAFIWYGDAINSGSDGSSWINLVSENASLQQGPPPHLVSSAAYRGARGIRLSYTVPEGEYAGGAMQITGGVNLSGNIASNQVLSFYTRGTAGSALKIYFVNMDGERSTTVSTKPYLQIGSDWQRVEIPLSEFLNSNFDGSQRALQLVVEGGPDDGSAYQVDVDELIIERPRQDRPLIHLNTASGSSQVAPGAEITAVADVHSAQGEIDFVEFYFNGYRVHTAEESPYTATFTVEEGDDRNLFAVAFDTHGYSRKSNVVVLSHNAPGEPGGIEELLYDSFESGSIDDSIWASGSTDSEGSIVQADGTIHFDSGQSIANARAGVVSHQHNLSPFADDPIKVSINGIELNGDPEPGTFAAFYAVIGRINGDTVAGDVTAAEAATYSGGGGGYGGALGFNILQFENGTWRLQLLDSGRNESGTGIVQQMQFGISGVPTDIHYEIDGHGQTWTIEISGATFLNVIVDQMGASIVDPTTISGPFSYLTEAGLTTDEGVIARFAMGAVNGGASLSTTRASVSEVKIVRGSEAEQPAPDSIFSGSPLIQNWRQTEMGYINDQNYPWVRKLGTETWLYIYTQGASPLGFYAYDTELESWIWSGIQLRGWYRNLSTNEWQAW